ncbi:hypothetical protein OIU84_001917 [Salix udensis]|uniref:Uncharacterized protein n=1 Tax=Salix udensis TaxID=889485 RepID=A0AAD6K831_9ROSI|nr:hypothetical protein OIU84_001917 [Salix udensis]
MLRLLHGKGKNLQSPLSTNRWSILDSDKADSSSGASIRIDDPTKRAAGVLSSSGLESNASTSNISVQTAVQPGGVSSEEDLSEVVVDDWEKAYD